MKLTISMPVYADYNGVAFSVQAIRIYQSLPVGTEILVLDNAPDTDDGRQTKKFIESFVPYGRYIPVTDRQSSFVKYDAFLHATGDVVLGIDSHVMLQPGAVKALLRWWEQHKGEPHNLTGPLIHDGLEAFSTHMDPLWRGVDYGTWATNTPALKKGVPFEVPMQGMGLFSFWRESFKPLTETFLAFGGEESFIAERVRQAGGKTICHPEVAWWHRFDWPIQRPFSVAMKERVRNYYVGWLSLYGSLDHPKVREMTEHWRKTVTEEELVWAMQQALQSRQGR
jgi:hypothetical protein